MNDEVPDIFRGMPYALKHYPELVRLNSMPTQEQVDRQMELFPHNGPKKSTDMDFQGEIERMTAMLNAERRNLKEQEQEQKVAARANTGKAKLSYFRRSFHKALEAVARVKEFGANKYNDNNWKLGGKPDQEYWDSFDRHADLFLRGEVYDKDSGCHHLGHMIWNLCAMFELNYGEVPVIDEKLFWDRMNYWAEQKKIEAGEPI